MLRWLAILALAAAPAHAVGDSIGDAVTRMYDFDFAGSHQILDQYIAAHPADPLPYAFSASAYLFSELDRMGILESEFLVDDEQIAAKKKNLSPDPATRKRFLAAVAATQQHADAVLKNDPNDKDALFAMCVAQGVSTDYMAFIEKRQISSLGVARRSNAYAQRLLRLDPRFYDAYLTAGINEYLLGSLPFFVRWFVHFENIDGNKQKGIERLQLVSREGVYFRPFAKILLGIIALREKRPRDAQRLLVELAHDYPDNPLFRNELAKVSARIASSGN